MPNFTHFIADEHETVELKLSVDYIEQPAEPEVGIMSAYIEVDCVSVVGGFALFEDQMLQIGVLPVKFHEFIADRFEANILEACHADSERRHEVVDRC